VWIVHGSWYADTWTAAGREASLVNQGLPTCAFQLTIARIRALLELFSSVLLDGGHGAEHVHITAGLRRNDLYHISRLHDNVLRHTPELITR
jgi:hypothetical protein